MIKYTMKNKIISWKLRECFSKFMQLRLILIVKFRQHWSWRIGKERMEIQNPRRTPINPMLTNVDYLISVINGGMIVSNILCIYYKAQLDLAFYLMITTHPPHKPTHLGKYLGCVIWEGLEGWLIVGSKDGWFLALSSESESGW